MHLGQSLIVLSSGLEPVTDRLTESISVVGTVSSGKRFQSIGIPLTGITGDLDPNVANLMVRESALVVMDEPLLYR